MPGFWQFPTVSMGLGPINAIYQARFMRYLENRGIIPRTPRKVWAFLGDGETDEPESLGALTLASREKLDNLIFVVNCNLQRLDGPVRGNGKIIQELEVGLPRRGLERDQGRSGAAAGTSCWRATRAACWSSAWASASTATTRTSPSAAAPTCARSSSASIPSCSRWSRTSPTNSSSSCPAAATTRRRSTTPTSGPCEHTGGPTVILAKTVKGYGMGEAGEGRNVTHQQKKLNEQELEQLPPPFLDSHPRRDGPHGLLLPPARGQPRDAVPARAPRRSWAATSRRARTEPIAITAPPLDFFAETLAGSEGREVSTTMAFVRALTLLLKHPELGRYIVPIIPDEARTFGMDSLFRQFGIYASQGQLYEPVDKEMFLYYKEAKDGQILEEGITEAGSMASFTAAGTAYANYGVPMIPFFIYYSMFGFQRVGDLVWAFGDSRGKGFLLGGTAGRTTLAGEGLQHQDGHSHVLFSTVPTCASYDPAYRLRDRRHPPGRHPADVPGAGGSLLLPHCRQRELRAARHARRRREGILKGIYRFKAAPGGTAVAHLFGSGSILNEALRAQTILAERFQVQADVWSVTSYNELRREALAVDRWNRLHPGEPPRRPYLLDALEGAEGPVVAATDYMKIVADQVSPWLPGRMTALGTDGFGRSDNRQQLRRHFEVNAEAIAASALAALAEAGQFEAQRARQALQELGVDTEAQDPARA